MTDEVNVRIKADSSGVDDPLKSLKEKIEGITAPIENLKSTLGGVAEAFIAAFAIDRIAEFAKGMAEMGERVEHASAMLGMSTEAVSALNTGFAIMGLGAEGGTRAMERLERSMDTAQTGTGRQANAFKALGISVTDASGHLKSSEEVLNELADSFSRSADGPAKTAIAIALLGRQGAEMIPYLDRGRAGLEEFRQKAMETGTLLDESTAKGMGETAEKMHTLSEAITGVGIASFQKLRPAIDAVVDGMTSFVEKLSASIRGLHSFQGAANAFAADEIRNRIDNLNYAIERQQSKIDQAKKSWNMFGQANVGNLQKELTVLQEQLAKYQAQLKDVTGDQEKEKAAADAAQAAANKEAKGTQGDKPDMQSLTEIEQRNKAETASAAASLALAKSTYAQETEVVKAFYAQGIIDIDTMAQMNQAAEDKMYQSKIESLGRQLKAADGNKVEEIKIRGEIAAAEIDYNTKTLTLTQQAWSDRTKAIKDEANKQIQVIDARNAYEVQQINNSRKNEDISIGQQTTALIQSENTRYNAVVDEMNKEITSYDKNSQAYKSMLSDMEKARIEHEKKNSQIVQTATEEQKKAYQGYFSAVESSMATSITGMITKTTTLQQAEQQVGTAIVQDMVGRVIKTVVNEWILGELAKTTVTQAQAAVRLGIENTSSASLLGMFLRMVGSWFGMEGSKTAATGAANTARVISDTGAAVASRGLAVASGFAQIGIDAAVAAAGTMAAISVIPYVGPFMAPEMAAEAYGTTMGFATGMGAGAFETGAWEIPGEMLGRLHPGEMVLPANLANMIRNGNSSVGAFPSGMAAASSGGNNNGQPGQLHVTFQITALDGASVATLLKSQGSSIASALAGEIRNANGSLSGALQSVGAR